MSTQDAVLELRNLRTEFRVSGAWHAAVRDVSLTVRKNETLAVVGESGSGKSVTALSVLRLLPEAGSRHGGGQILLEGRDLAVISEKQMAALRGDAIAMIFQEPMTSLNPVLSIGRQLTEAVRVHQNVSREVARKAALNALDAVRISEPARRLQQYPHELSGGMRQRVMIAMALACNPKVLVADEPTTALDVTVQAQILALMRSLQRDLGTALILITHDMGVVAEMADRVVVIGFQPFRARLDPASMVAGAPRLADVAANILDGLLVDQVVDDLHRLATINSFIVDSPGHGPRGAADAYRAARGRKPYKKISYALVAPERRGELAAVADEVFDQRYAGLKGWLRPDYPFMSRLLGGGRSPSRGELLSFLLFDEEHVERLIEMGRRDAHRWLDRHPGVWCSDAAHDFDIDTSAIAHLREREALDEWRTLRRR